MNQGSAEDIGGLWVVVFKGWVGGRFAKTTLRLYDFTTLRRYDITFTHDLRVTDLRVISVVFLSGLLRRP